MAANLRTAILCGCLTGVTVGVGAQDAPFVRGDINLDGAINIADPIAVLSYLFGPAPEPSCVRAADIDDSGRVNITDPLYVLQYLFSTGSPPPPPFPDCGEDPTPDTLGCRESSCPASGFTLLISEFMADNLGTLVDEDGDTSDWIELHVEERSGSPVADIGGWFLTDDPDDLTRWRIPDGTVIERGGFLVLYASGKDRTEPGAELHTGFRLDADGDYLALVEPDGVTVAQEFAPEFPEQRMDVSYGPIRQSTELVRVGDPILYRVPTAEDAGDSWTAPELETTDWHEATNGVGFTSTEDQVFDVTWIKASVVVDHISIAEEVAADPSLQAEVAHGTATTVNFFASGDSGNYASDQTFPGMTGAEVDDFVVVVRGSVLIPEAGIWTFGVGSDDGFRLDLTGDGASFSTARETPRAAANTLSRFDIPSAGPYELKLVYFQRDGAAELELFAAQGFRPFFNTTDFQLVGDVAAGGLGLIGIGVAIATEIAGDMHGVNASVWLRSEFDVSSVDSFGELMLRMTYEDGFVAYLNGEEVARRNAPSGLSWDSSAAGDRPAADVSLAELIDLTSRLGLLRVGTNVLAIHGLNDSASDGDFLVRPELTAVGADVVQNYMPQPTPGTPNVPGAVGFVREVEFSVDRGFHDEPFTLELTTPTPQAEIRYTLDGSTPTPARGAVYEEPLVIDGTTVIRAVGWRPDHLDSYATTRTYLFVADVVRQSPQGQSPGPGWPGGRVNGQFIDYGMDPAIVDSARWGDQVEDALLAIPSISLVTDLGNLFDPTSGIYVNATNDGMAWERRTSVELLHPDGSEGFGTDAGLRIRGAFSRQDSNPKHAFRLIFRSLYGDGKLDYPLFGGEGVDRFDKIDLRTSQNYSWAFDGSDRNTFLRDVFSRDVQRDMGQPYTRSRYYHLYVNGHYWGVFQTQERADADFAASYLGGGEDDYDVIKNDSSGSRALQATSGTMDSYRRLYDAAVAGFSTDAAYLRVLGLDADGEPDPEGERLVDERNLMDYMICTYFTGDPDAPVSAWGHFSNNVFAVYDREEPAGFSWYRHDAEHSLGVNGGLYEGRLLTDSRDRTIGEQWRHFNPAWLHLRLTENAEYRLEFADRVSRYFAAGGLLSPAENVERWLSRADRIDVAIIAESARWGDSKRQTPLTKDDWQAERDWVVDEFFPFRTQIVIDQMRSVDMIPDAAFVVFGSRGGEVEAGFELVLSQENGNPGTIYYTLDGTDPRQWGGAVASSAEIYPDGAPADTIVIQQTTTVRARVRAGSEWGALTEARFTVGLQGLVINELMASNSTTLEDPAEPGEFPDWIELYNGTGAAVELGGMYLSDDALEPTAWQFADGVSIGAGEYLVIYADDDGTQGPLHTSFQLSRSGETVILLDVDGETVIDSVLFDGQTPDVSYGRFPDGDGPWGFHEEATPGSANSSHAP